MSNITESFYCCKCRETLIETVTETAKSVNGRNMVKGKCKKCGTKLNKFVK